MEIAKVEGAELEYEVHGTGEPVLLVSPVLADGFVPLMRRPELADHQLVHYHKRGWVGSRPSGGPVSVQDHVGDAVGLLDHLGVRRAHVVGHSSGAAVAAQMALDAPGRVHSLVLLELSLLALPEGRAFLAAAGPVFAAYEADDHEGALAMFLGTVSGLEPEACLELLEDRVPGIGAQTRADADTFFGVELPGLAAWDLTRDRAATIRCPVLSVRGSRTLPLWVEVAAFLRSAIPDVEERVIDDVGHLLHLQDPAPVASALQGFLARHPIPGPAPVPG